jgi:ATP-binding cassette subfamily B protein
MSLALAWRSDRRLVLIVTAVQIVGAAAAAAQVALFGYGLFVLDSAPPDTVVVRLIPVLVAYLVAYTIERAAGAVQIEQTSVLSGLMSAYARQRLLEAANRADLIGFEQAEFYDRLRRASQSSEVRALAMAQGLATLCGSLARIVGVGAAVALIQPILLVPMAVVIIPLWKIMEKNSSDTYMFFFGMTKLERERDYVYGLAADRNAAKEVRSFYLEDYLGGRFAELARQQIAELRVTARRRQTRRLTGVVLNAALLAATLALITWLYMAGRASLAATGTAIAAYLQFSVGLLQLLTGMSALYETSLFLEDYTTFVGPGKAGGPAASPAGPPLDEVTSIETVRVSFSYPGTPSKAVRGVSIRVARGEVVALVGPNGSGKTTLAKILTGLYAPDAGEVRWNGAAVGPEQRLKMRDQIAPIFQDFVHYEYSVRENVGFGRHERLDDAGAIRAAVDAAGADELVSGLDRGLDARLGRLFEGGQDLSIGQWQRVALARAFFRDGSLVVLDEPTAALDARAEQELFDRVRELCRNRAVLLISHRFGTVRSADRIYVMRGGEVVESGDHDGLIAQNGLYREMFDLQAAAFLAPSQAMSPDGGSGWPSSHDG